jgi:hypothetical protein
MVVRRCNFVLDADPARKHEVGCDGEQENCAHKQNVHLRFPRYYLGSLELGGEPDSVRFGGNALPGAAGCGCPRPWGLRLASAHLKYAMYSRISSSECVLIGHRHFVFVEQLLRRRIAWSICSGDFNHLVSQASSRRLVTP